MKVTAVTYKKNWQVALIRLKFINIDQPSIVEPRARRDKSDVITTRSAVDRVS